jgi:hypothetical protein
MGDHIAYPDTHLVVALVLATLSLLSVGDAQT